MKQPQLFALPARRGRWALIPLGIVVMLCLGTAYSWTIFRTSVQQTFQASATASLLPFTVLLLVFSVFMPITGFVLDRIGARRVMAIGAVTNARQRCCCTREAAAVSQWKLASPSGGPLRPGSTRWLSGRSRISQRAGSSSGRC